MAFDAPILETFTVGADVSPLSNDTKWALFNTGGATARIEADVDAVTPNAASPDAFYYYTSVVSVPDLEVRFRVQVKATDGGRLGVFLRGSNPGTQFNGYWLRVETAAGTDLVVLGRIDAGVTTALDSASREIANSDEYCLRAIGSHLEGWVRPNGGGPDELVVEDDDATYSSGLAGLSVRTVAAQFDDFGWVSLSDSQVGQYVTRHGGRGAGW